MAKPVITGNLANSVFKKPFRTRQGWDKQSGRYIEYTYREPELLARNHAALLEASGNYDQVSLEQNGVLWEVTARTSVSQAQNGDQETPTTDVNLSANRTTKDIFDHPAFDGMSYSELQTARRILRNPESISGNVSIGIPFFYTSEGDRALKIFMHALKGVEHFYVYSQTLSVTRVASSVYQFEVSYTNVGRLISTPSLANETGAGDLIRFTLPNEDSTKTDMAYAWLKHRPSYQSYGGGGRKAVSQDYEYGLWSIPIYGEVI